MWDLSQCKGRGGHGILRLIPHCQSPQSLKQQQRWSVVACEPNRKQSDQYKRVWRRIIIISRRTPPPIEHPTRGSEVALESPQGVKESLISEGLARVEVVSEPNSVDEVSE
jgi:hypothetical protein